jgi:hypothetical protein
MILSTEVILLTISLMGNIFILLKRIRYISCFGEACSIDCRSSDSPDDSARSEQSVIKRAITKFKINRPNKITTDLPV